MKRLCLIIFIALMIPAFANAKETMILYHQYQIPGPQTTKYWYIKESLTGVAPKNPNLLQVKTYVKVISPEGVTKYRIAFQINCEARKYKITKYWSSGFGDKDFGLMVTGKWESGTDYEEMVALMNAICLKK